MEKWRLNGFYTKAQLRRWQENIPLRYSCRAFEKTPSVAQWTTLSYAAARVCLPGVRIILGACDESFFTPAVLKLGRIEGATRFAAILIDYRVPMAALHGGISGEAFALEATSCGLGTCWVTGTYRKKENPVIPEPYEDVAAVIALGVPKEASPYPLKRKRKPLKRFIEENPAALPPWAKAACDALVEAPSALNQQPWKLRYGAGSLAYLGKGDINDGIAVLHMEAALWDTPRLWTLEEANRQVGIRVRPQGE